MFHRLLGRAPPVLLARPFGNRKHPDIDRPFFVSRVRFDRTEEKIHGARHGLVVVLDRGPEVHLRWIEFADDEVIGIGANSIGFFKTGKVREVRPEVLLPRSGCRDRNRLTNALQPGAEQ